MAPSKTLPQRLTTACCCQTLYSVRAEILPPVGEQHCRSGFLCGLEVCITRLTEPAEGEVAEETDTDGLKTTKLMYEGMSGEQLII